nr:MAG TPA_asm: hypothetical protein [Caudoviricetes sp.]
MIRQVSEKGLRPLFRFLFLCRPVKPFFILLPRLLPLYLLSFSYPRMHPLHGAIRRI